ncbi:type II secretion system F family protein [Candidatus Micrarchaeota archaeon]|nr:type II secretion system F family protein [Candidatus Micrarchaeota archaeon]MBU1939672.1 type II secretion system F family protein [Candidatus Micrarchaeota archaeon]
MGTNFYRKVASLMPSKIIRAFKTEMGYLGIDISERRFVGFLLVFGLALSVGISLNTYLFFGISFIVAFPFFFVLFVAGTYLWLSIAAESKGKFVETILPDALQLIASNIKAGLTTERALLVSARSEFGPLEIELRATGSRIMAGMPLEQALSYIPTKIKSKTLERLIWLISKGIESGGQIADLLTHLADDLREQNSIKDEIAANISMYIMLIFFSAAIGAPMLFGISSFIVQILVVQTSQIPQFDASMFEGTGGGAGLAGLAGGGSVISADFVIFFAMVSIVVTSIFASLTIGVINTGKEKGGAKFIPVLLSISFVLFFVIREVLAMMFGSLLM